MRASLGLKPLPVPGQDPEPDTSHAADSDDDAPSTLESRESKAYENFKKIRDAEEDKRKREERATIIKKARDAAQRFASLKGKGFGEEQAGGDQDAKSWLLGQKKRQKMIQKSIEAEEQIQAAKAKAAAEKEYTSKDLAGIKVSHDISNFVDGHEQILTLKDSTINENDEEGDELEAFAVREKEKLAEKLDLKNKKPPYNPYDLDDDGNQTILGHYDEEISRKKKNKVFTLQNHNIVPEISDILSAPIDEKQEKSMSIDDVLEMVPSSDYMDVKVKRPKKKKSKSTRHKKHDKDDMLFNENALLLQGDEMEVDLGAGSRKRRRVEEDLVDDDDLQRSLAIQRKNALTKRKTRPEDIARQVQDDPVTPPFLEVQTATGLVIDDISEFVTGLSKLDEKEEKPRKAKTRPEDLVTAMDIESDDDEVPIVKLSPDDLAGGDEYREDSAVPEVSGTGVEEEKSVGQGMGATLSLLKERGLVKETNSSELNESQRQNQLFLAEKRRRMEEFEEEARRQRERERASGKLDRMSQREREEYARQQNAYRDQQISRIMNDLFKQGYRPQVELKYTDEYGRRLNQKEAFKHLSHQFHGKGSGKGKTDKRLKKIESEKRREAQSMLDASQNVGMSSATAQQLKKRKEAGVRLA